MPELQALPNQNFECRDCPSRCCTSPWVVGITQKEKDRFEGEEWIRQRLAEKGVTFQQVRENSYAIPHLVHDRKLQCVFLDEDSLCSIYKRNGREFWAETCRMFPIKFIQDETGATQPVLSHYCPSIRDNYGLPLTPARLTTFLVDGGKPTALAPSQLLGIQTKLKPAQVKDVIDLWIGILRATPDLSEALYLCQQKTDKLELEVLELTEADDAAWSAALANVRTAETEPLRAGAPEREAGMLPNLLESLELLRLAFPYRVYGITKFTVTKGLSTYRLLMSMAREKGELDLLLTPKPFQLEEAAAVSAASANPELVERMRAFLILVLERRYYLRDEATISGHLLHLILTYVILLRFTRYHAVARGSTQPESIDLREAISAAEFLISRHNTRSGPIMDIVKGRFIGNLPNIRKLLLCEV